MILSNIHNILAFGADLNEGTNEDAEYTTPLILACQSCHLKNQFEIIQCLLENQASPNQSIPGKSQRFTSQISYQTPLITYIKQADQQRLDMRIIRLLLAHGARVSFSHHQGQNFCLGFLCQALLYFCRFYPTCFAALSITSKPHSITL